MIKEYYHTNLLHFQSVGANYSVTSILKGSIPLEIVKELKSNYETSLLKLNPKDKKGRTKAWKIHFARFDGYMDTYKAMEFKSTSVDACLEVRALSL